MSGLTPNLFDKRFADLVEIGRARLPPLAPDWTDHNAHDPGITLMELLAWVAEAQLYSLSHLRRDERAAYAALLGIAPGGTQGARGLIWPDRSDPNSPVTTYARTRVLSTDTVINVIDVESPTFRPTDTLLWVPGRITALVTRRSDGQTIDQKSANDHSVAFLPFGEGAGRREVLSMDFECRDEKGLFGEESLPTWGARLAIGVLAAPPIDGAGLTSPRLQDCCSPLAVTLISSDERVPLRVVLDTTQGFLTTGVLLLDLDDVKVKPTKFTLEFTAPDGLPGSPRLLRIEPNVIPISQGRTISREAHESKGQPDLIVTLEEPGLRFAAGQHPITLEVDEPAGLDAWFVFSVGPDIARELDAGQISDRMRKQFQDHGIVLGPQVTTHALLTGYSWMIVDAAQTYLVLVVDQNLNIYRTWTRVQHLSEHGPDENVYELDARVGQITFGNGVNGRIPPAGSNVYVSYAVSDGEQGNVARNRKWKTAGIEGVFGTNPEPITGGASSSGWIEERREARRRSREDHALVTEEDIAAAARALPLLDVARAWVAAPNASAPQTGVLTLVALRSRADGVEPEQIPETAGWLEAIRRSLAPRIPMGTRLAVVAPRYKDFSIQATLEAHPRQDPKMVKDTVIRVLRVRFSLDGSTEDTTPRQPGVPVTGRDVAAWLRGVQGVSKVVEVHLLDAGGAEAPEITVPRNGLPRWNENASKINVNRSVSGSAP